MASELDEETQSADTEVITEDVNKVEADTEEQDPRVETD